MRRWIPAVVVTLLTAPTLFAADAFPFLQIDAKAKQVRVECEALRCENPLEFFLCLTGTNEYESVLRSKVKPSHLHAALLMIGLKPGEPVRFSEALQKWLPPHGPPLAISVEFEKDGKLQKLPAYRLMRDFKNKREMPPLTWIFAGSRVMEDDTYAADRTGYLISVVNFDFTVIDIPELASNANETLHWMANLDVVPPMGTKVTLLIEPAGKVEAPAAVGTTQPVAQKPAPVDLTVIGVDADGTIRVEGQAYSSAMLPRIIRQIPKGQRVRVAVANAIEENAVARDVINGLSAAEISFDTIPQATATTAPKNGETVQVDDAMIRRLREQWEHSVAPHDKSLREAAKTHYDVIGQLRREQQRLIDEADKIQRLIDQLEKQYQDMTTPRPE